MRSLFTELKQDARHGLRLLVRIQGSPSSRHSPSPLASAQRAPSSSVLDAVVLQPLPFRAPDRLVFVQELNPQGRARPPLAANLAAWKPIIRHVVFRPIGLAPAEPLPGDRARFYVPRSDDDPLRGRRLMYMRDLACCAGTMASYSTASDLVRVGLASDGSVNGELAGGMVMSLMALRDSGIVVAVLSNIALANTPALGLKIGDAFAKQAR